MNRTEDCAKPRSLDDPNGFGASEIRRRMITRSLSLKTGTDAAAYAAPPRSMRGDDFSCRRLLRGEPGWVRTIDPLIKSQLLYH
jgi:hypothetical protein